jgi:hypothetical protein
VKTPKKKTPAAPPATTLSATQAARARESLRRLLTDYAHVPAIGALLAAEPEPKVAKPKPRRAQRGGDPGAAGGGTVAGGGGGGSREGARGL